MLTTLILSSALQLFSVPTQKNAQYTSLWNTNRIIRPPHHMVILPPTETCDGIDNDGNGLVDEDFDWDEDGYFAGEECEDVYAQLDCNDEDATLHPNAEEVCDGVDNNCNSAIDEAPQCSEEEPGGVEQEGDLIGVYQARGELWWMNSVDASTSAMSANEMPVALNVSGATAVVYDAMAQKMLVATGEGDDALYTVGMNNGAVQRVGALSANASNIQAMDIAPEQASAHGFVPGALYGISIDGFS
ncbi:MAG TPA: putative metal-binding motif-containing protein, partial [Patescibacteria group bacterium]|nr:putative metal-binding motif-containing protein [Patescibacteria group bacterium]